MYTSWDMWHLNVATMALVTARRANLAGIADGSLE
jgi:hypothetical protein